MTAKPIGLSKLVMLATASMTSPCIVDARNDELSRLCSNLDHMNQSVKTKRIIKLSSFKIDCERTEMEKLVDRMQ